MQVYPVFRVPIEALRPTSGEAANLQVVPIFQRPARLSFYSAVDGRPREVPELEVRERPPSTLRNVDGGPPRGAGAEGSKIGDVDGGPLGVLAVGLAAITTEVEDIDAGGAGGKVR
jgi:hypothetical protein